MQLLEREACLHTLDTALHSAIAGKGQAVLISGEAGIGKTALVERFVNQRKHCVRVLWGACDALFTPRPLGPLHDMAAQLEGSLPALLRSDTDRSAVFAAVLAELHQNPVIAIFEDVHWADEATLDLLRFLGRRIARASALLVLTYRDDELGLSHPLRSLLGDLTTAPTTHRLPLPPLSFQAVQALVGRRPIDACKLHRQTGGNPFFVTEVLASDGDRLPSRISDAVLARTARLSPLAMEALQASAVIGPRIEPWLLAEIGGVEPQAVDECLSSGILVAQGELLAFRHELARQTVLDVISPLRRMALHRMTLKALKTTPAIRSDMARLAHHAESARDPEAVLAYAPAAAEQAVAASAHREAAALYGLTLRFATDLPAAEHAQLLELYARECHLIDQRDTSVQMLRAALQLWREVDRPLREGAILAKMANALMGLGQDAEADQCARAAVGILEAQPESPELAKAYNVRATQETLNHNPEAAIYWAEKSFALAERLASNYIRFTAQNILGSSWLYLDYELGCRQLEQAQAAAHASGYTSAAVYSYAQLGSISSELYYFRQAERYLSAGLAYATQYGLHRLQFYMLAWQAWTYLHLGAWNEATEAAEVVLRDASLATENQLMALVALGRLRARRGDPQAQVVLDEASQLAQSVHNIDRLGPLYTARAEAAWSTGDRDRTIEAARAAYDLAVSKQHAWFTGELAFWRWRAGDEVELPPWTARPFALHIAGDWRAAADEWLRLGCPYEQARALADGDYDAQTIALTLFEKLGAQPAADELRRKMRRDGALRIPRGPRSSTRENPFGLTARQMDILYLIGAGLSNAEIAERLYISPKTVDHHVSAVLSRLDVPSRKAAAELIRQHPCSIQHGEHLAPI
ncbi:MAG TPA: AAA family ATPase [Herpetosiphonaceae bacterium]